MDIDYPGFGRIVVAGERHDHDIVVTCGAVRARDKGPSRDRSTGGHTPLSAAEELPWGCPELVIGTGHSGALPVLEEVHREAERRGVTVVAMPTAEACALLRDRDPAQVCAVLHVTC